MSERRGDWIQTYTGLRFYPLDPRPEEIDLRDIAHALAIVPRFGGHTKYPYTVGQHSILVSHQCDPRDALWGLLHDASEAYLLDCQRPLKQLPEFAFYREIEDIVQRAICDRFGLDPVMPTSVHQADRDVLLTEAQELMAYPGRPLGPEWDKWFTHHKPAPVRIDPRPWDEVEDHFLARFRYLTEHRG